MRYSSHYFLLLAFLLLTASGCRDSEQRTLTLHRHRDGIDLIGADGKVFKTVANVDELTKAVEPDKKALRQIRNGRLTIRCKGEIGPNGSLVFPDEALDVAVPFLVRYATTIDFEYTNDPDPRK